MILSPDEVDRFFASPPPKVIDAVLTSEPVHRVWANRGRISRQEALEVVVAAMDRDRVLRMAVLVAAIFAGARHLRGRGHSASEVEHMLRGWANRTWQPWGPKIGEG